MVKAPMAFPGKTLVQREAYRSLLLNDSTLIAQYPQLQKAIIRERLVASASLPETGESFSRQLQAYARLTPFEAMSLAAKRQQDLFGHAVNHGMMGQLNILGIIQFITDLFK